MTSHAAVVARGWGKTCICGCGELKINEKEGTMTFGGKTYKEGDFISLNGESGEVLDGKMALKPPSTSSPEVRRFMQWVDIRRDIKILTNADTPEDALEARKNGAQGVGLVRTEHMFFSPDRINVVRRMILAQTFEQRQKALDELLPFQRSGKQRIFLSTFLKYCSRQTSFNIYTDFFRYLFSQNGLNQILRACSLPWTVYQ